MIRQEYIKVSNYKCFGKNMQGFDKVYPINIIIGKNNSGKSSLIEMIQFSIDGNDEFSKSMKNNIFPEVHFEYYLTSSDVDKIPPQAPLRQNIVGNRMLVKSSFMPNTCEVWENIPNSHLQQYANNIAFASKYFQSQKTFKRITAERDIILEGGANIISLSPNGRGATQLIQLILSNTKFNPATVSRKMLEELNKILSPEIEYKDIRTLFNERLGGWEIYFEESMNGYIPLSKIGSGIKTILLVLINLIVLPETENTNKSDYVFAFEELENNLHPALLRRLFAYITEYCEKNKSYFFITTHSNTVIDIFGSNPNAQIIHTKIENGEGICTPVTSYLHNRQILKDLDVKASDLLQSNGIIWVEGPSDRVYINKWLRLIAPDLKEGLHYSILFYGGRLLANLTFDFEWLETEFIPLLKVNHNAFVVIDRDGEDETKINSTKNRIQNEIGNDNCWITDGREIENYLTAKSVSAWLKNNYATDKEIELDPNKKIEELIDLCNNKIKYASKKKSYSMEIVEYITKDDLDILDLNKKMNDLVKAIKEWNSLK